MGTLCVGPGNAVGVECMQTAEALRLQAGRQSIICLEAISPWTVRRQTLSPKSLRSLTCSDLSRRTADCRGDLSSLLNGRRAGHSFCGQRLACQQTMKRVVKGRRKVTSAAWQDDAPFVIAIGVAFAATAAPLIFPVPWSVKAAVDKKKRFDEFNTFGSEDTKFTAMGVVSVLPLFNWLAWVLAWLDSSDPRYALYAAVYLAPWIKSGLNFTEDWLPLGAVALGAAHVQLERYVQSEGPARSLPIDAEHPTLPQNETKVPGGAFDDREWGANVQKKDIAKLKPLTEDQIRQREEKWELKRWDEKFTELLEAEAAAEERLPQDKET